MYLSMNMRKSCRSKRAEQMIQLSRSGDDSRVVLVPSDCYCVTSAARGDGSWASILTAVLVVTLQSNKVPVVQPSHAVHPLTPLITYSDEHFSPGSHPSHLPSDVSSKQGESPASLPRPLWISEESHLISLSDLTSASAHVTGWVVIHL